MISSLLADAVLLLHFVFVSFVIAGGLLVLWWPKLAWLHLPAAAWGALVELAGWICPLTPLENEFRARAGRFGYSGGFVEHYLTPLIYPSALTSKTQLLLGIGVIAVNSALYGVLLVRARRRRVLPS